MPSRHFFCLVEGFKDRFISATKDGHEDGVSVDGIKLAQERVRMLRGNGDAVWFAPESRDEFDV